MKTYIKPEMEVINISIQNIICVSGVGKGTQEVYGGAALGRGYDFDSEYEY